MIQSGKGAERFMRTGQPVLGKGWKEVDTFEDLEDADEYESDDEVSRLVRARFACCYLCGDSSRLVWGEAQTDD